jgi:hypothetical protein
MPSDRRFFVVIDFKSDSSIVPGRDPLARHTYFQKFFTFYRNPCPLFESVCDFHNSGPSLSGEHILQRHTPGRTRMAETASQKSVSLTLEDFIEAASKAALRAVDARAAELNPQPLPPRSDALPIPPGRIFVGIIAGPESQREFQKERQ